MPREHLGRETHYVWGWRCLRRVIERDVPTHDARFTGSMDLHLPSWQSVRQTLDRLPVRHEAWQYGSSALAGRRSLQ